MLRALSWLLLASFCFGSASSQAAILINGETNTIAASGNCDLTACPDLGDHFHSDVYFTDLAEVGGYAASGGIAREEIRGMSEFDLAGMTHASSAILTFSVYRQGGMFFEDFNANGDPFTGTILVDAYPGNNSIFGNNWDIFTFENIWSDYEEPSIGDVGYFDVVGGATPSPNVGYVFSFDVTELLNDAIDVGLISLGIRLRQDRTGEEYGTSKAWTFQSFRLTAHVPEPGTVALIGLALAGLGFSRRKHAAK